MSKSEGNFFTIREVANRHEPEALRWFLLNTHYRTPINFEAEDCDSGVRYPALEEAEQRLCYAYTTRKRLSEALAVGKPGGEGDVIPEVAAFDEKFDGAMSDDFNTAAALGHAAELLTTVNKLLDQPKAVPKALRRRTLERIDRQLGRVASVLGVIAESPDAFLDRRRGRLCKHHGIDPAVIERRIEERNEARAAKDYARADTIRDELLAQKIEVMDSGGCSTWRVLE